ncbi:MAG: DUF2726 domain-containing protein [Gammaproteobacteria bacterium]|nr:DUF2726 domain-containing protein [Gammaproteobacteria bacterium]
MNSQNIIFDGLAQVFSTMPSFLWVVIVVALMLSSFLKVFAKLLLPKFTTKSLLNKSEIRLFKVLQQVTPSGFHLFAQVSYGEFLRCANNRKFWTINAKRADFVICDTEFNVIAAIEYQGRGHHGSNSKSHKNAKHRDSVKRNALTEANIPMIEIFPKFDQTSVSESLDFVFNPPVDGSVYVKPA